MPERGPSLFIEKKLEGGDVSIEFGQSILPYLYNAFRLWRAFVYKNSGEEIRKALSSQEVKAIDKWARAGIGLLYPDTPIKLQNFSAEIEGCKIPEDPEEIERIVNAWRGMMLRKTWNSDIEGEPWFIDLTYIFPLTVGYLPKIIRLDGYPMIRLMDSFYAPDKQGADWSKKLFNYIGPDRYEKMADLELKEEIDRILIGDISGNVLDVGCGSGLLQEWLNKWGKQDVVLFGIDVSSAMLEKARQRGERVIEADMAKISDMEILERFGEQGFTVSCFDYVVMSYVDNWLSDEERKVVFQIVFSLLKEGGGFHFNIYDKDYKEKGQKYYRELLEAVGFKEIVIEQQRLKARDGFRDVYFVFAKKYFLV